MNKKINCKKLYITELLQEVNNKITEYLSNINTDYTKEDYEIIRKDFWSMEQEISRLRVIKKNEEEFFDLTFENKFHHNSHFSNIDEEINYWNCLLHSKKSNAAINKYIGTEDRIKKLKEMKKKYHL